MVLKRDNFMAVRPSGVYFGLPPNAPQCYNYGGVEWGNCPGWKNQEGRIWGQAEAPPPGPLTATIHQERLRVQRCLRTPPGLLPGPSNKTLIISGELPLLSGSGQGALSFLLQAPGRVLLAVVIVLDQSMAISHDGDMDVHV